jgi:hypothetical protein
MKPTSQIWSLISLNGPGAFRPSRSSFLRWSYF